MPATCNHFCHQAFKCSQHEEVTSRRAVHLIEQRIAAQRERHDIRKELARGQAATDDCQKAGTSEQDVQQAPKSPRLIPPPASKRRDIAAVECEMPGNRQQEGHPYSFMYQRRQIEERHLTDQQDEHQDIQAVPHGCTSLVSLTERSQPAGTASFGKLCSTISCVMRT